MDKNAIKKYAVWARRELIARVSQRAALYEITAEGYGDADAVSVHGQILSLEEKSQRRALIAQIQQKGFEQVMEEIAYTWFNRFSALRFMEVNGYLPTRIRVFTDEENSFKPQIMTEAINLEMDGLDMQKVFAFKDANDDDGLFKYLIITQCNALSSILPGMFQKISDYTELLFPDNLLREGSVVEQMVSMIPEEDWTDQVQIIGWLYQYYNTEPKDKVFANLKKNIKISKENIPAATQLFTPDWIVRYMVENSLGRIWIEGHPNDELKARWKYYLDEAEQEEEVQKQLAEIRKEYAVLKPEDIRCIDPCMGSGHILVYMFDVLMQIYETYGYTAREAATSIVEHNIWGLDIDDRAAQLAYFSVMMKARQYDRRFFERKVQPHVYAIEESNGITKSQILGINLAQDLTHDENTVAVNQLLQLVNELHDAKEYGSLLHVQNYNWDLLRRLIDLMYEGEQMPLDVYGEIQTLKKAKKLINIGLALSQKYSIIVTNPPYMGLKQGMSEKLSEYVRSNYPDSKSDLYATFIDKLLSMVKKNGFIGMITQHSWMFQTSFIKIRKKVLNQTIVNLVHLGARAFDEIGGEVVQSCAFVIKKHRMIDFLGQYMRLVEGHTAQAKEIDFLENKNIYLSYAAKMLQTDDAILSYWLSDNFYEAFRLKKVSADAYTFQGIITGQTEKYLRLWYEIDFEKITFNFSNTDKLETIDTYFPYIKGGGYRRWYGNLDYVIHWENNGRSFIRSRTENRQYFFKKGLTWSDLCTGLYSCRAVEKGFLFDASGPMLFLNNNENYYSMLGYFNSKVFQKLLDINSPGLHYGNGAISCQPVSYGNAEVSNIVKSLIDVSRDDWDSFENSWNFKCHPLVRGKGLIEDFYEQWKSECERRFKFVKESEEKLNKIYIEDFNFENEMTCEIKDSDVSVRKADVQRDIKGLISYAVGCMFGRYSIDFPGLITTSKKIDDSKFLTFKPDKDGIIPICDDEYFEDDIIERFISFIETVFGETYREENLRFIADALNGKGTSREVIRNYFITKFFSDHCVQYSTGSSGKRPIYWLFDSGKKNGFKCLVYMHRYQQDTIARIRTDYVHEQQSRYRTTMTDLQNRIDNANSTSERVKLSKKLKTVREQDEELRIYEEKIHHLADQMISIDLDDGVKVNYAKFQDVLAKIK